MMEKLMHSTFNSRDSKFSSYVAEAFTAKLKQYLLLWMWHFDAVEKEKTMGQGSKVILFYMIYIELEA